MAKSATDRVAKVAYFNASKPSALPSVWLKLDGFSKPFVLMQYTSTFAKNEVPTATCVLGTGNPVRGKKNATAKPEELAADLDGAELLKAQVFIKFGPHSKWVPPSKGGTEWGNEAQCVFEGYYAGLSYSRVGSQIQMTVTLVHRLVDLTFSSLLTGWMHPSNPANLLQPAVASLLGGCKLDDVDLGGKKGAWTAGVFMKELVENGGPQFGENILETLQCMTQMDVFKMDCADVKLPRRPNTEAEEVLDSCVSKTGSLRGPDLTLPPFKSSIGNYLGRLIDTNQGTTYWDLLVNKICPDFVMSVIPFPSIESSPNKAYAFLTADTPGLDTPYKTLYLEDYTGFSLKARLWKPLYAVGVYSDGTDLVGSEFHGNKQIPRKGAKCIGGMFPHPDDPALKDQVGQFLVVRSPEWLRDLSLLTGNMSNFGETGKGARDAMDAEDNFPKPDFEPADIQEQKSNVMHDYAKLIYVHNAINGRGGSFDSKLRFDICPGTILKLDKGLSKGGDSASKHKDLPGNVLVQVSRVSHNINSESPMAKTTFECVHLRTEAEMDADKLGRYSVDKHVFLTEAFKGAPMIEKWKF